MAKPRARTKRSPTGKKQAKGNGPLSQRQRAAFAKRLSRLVPAEPLADQRTAAEQLAKGAPFAPPDGIRPNQLEGVTEHAQRKMVRLAPGVPDAHSKMRRAQGRAVAPKSPPKNIPHA